IQANQLVSTCFTNWRSRPFSVRMAMLPHRDVEQPSHVPLFHSGRVTFFFDSALRSSRCGYEGVLSAPCAGAATGSVLPLGVRISGDSRAERLGSFSFQALGLGGDLGQGEICKNTSQSTNTPAMTKVGPEGRAVKNPRHRGRPPRSQHASCTYSQ